jgi:hypothetical protein
MIDLSSPIVAPPIDYPGSDGLPIADNTKQMRWIVALYDQQPFLTFEDLRSQFELERHDRLAAEQRANQAELRATRLAELSRKARRHETSPEELAELEKLEQDLPQ